MEVHADLPEEELMLFGGTAKAKAFIVKMAKVAHCSLLITWINKTYNLPA